ncbi:ABC transporter permease [Mycoplasmopsis agassizii]|uniref:ABC transporter permease n=1 Tax=Mycoplasmopsis agassizii TaxID=33922 RepID=UPI00352904BB
MINYFLKRAGLALLSLFLLTFISYLLLATYGRDPFISLLDRGSTAGVEEQIANLREAAGFNKPVIQRYFIWLGDIFSGDLGSMYNPSSTTTVRELFFEPLPYSIRFVLPSFIFSAFFGTSLGIIAAYHRGKFIDFSINLFVKIFISLPSFVLAPFFLLLAFKLGLQIRLDPRWSTFDSRAVSALLMPILLISIISMAGYAGASRNITVDVLGSNYILIAKAKGMRRSAIFFKYVFRNISIPIFAIVVPSFTGLLGGSFIIERFFNIPGTSTTFIQAFPAGELDLIMWTISFYGAITLGMSILIDISLTFLDPRIKIANKANIDIFKVIYWWFKRRKLESENAKKEKGVVNGQ